MMLVSLLIFTVFRLVVTTHGQGSSGFLLFTDSSQGFIYKANRHGYGLLSSPKIIIHSSFTPQAVSYDPTEQRIYWSDAFTSTISLAFLNGSSEETIVRYVKAVAIAVDPAGRNLYWADNKKGRIEVARLDGSHRKILVRTTRPTDMALDLSRRQIYWSSDSLSAAIIERSSMDGSDRQVIVSGLIYGTPSGLCLDSGKRVLYWTEKNAPQIFYVSLDNPSGHHLYYFQARPSKPFKLTILDQRIYWTDRGSYYYHGKVASLNITSKKDLKIMTNNVYKPKGIYAFAGDGSLIPESNCSRNNGGCSHLCLLSPRQDRVCSCSNGMALKDDGKTCHYKEFLLVVDDVRRKIFHKSLDDLSRPKTPLALGQTGRIMTVDFDPQEHKIYWTNKRGVISRAFLNGSSIETVVNSDNYFPRGHEIDVIGRNIYWFDSKYREIGVCKLDGSCQTILMTLNEQPEAIVLDSRKGVIYWVTTGNTATIERVHMNGENREVLVRFPRRYHYDYTPRALALDSDNNRLYWVDDNRGEICYTETDPKTGQIHHVGISSWYTISPYSLALKEGYIYWGDGGNAAVYRVNKASKRKVTKIVRSVDAIDLHVYHNNTQVLDNNHPCAQFNGWCTHLCLLKPGGYSCVCPGNKGSRPCYTTPVVPTPSSHYLSVMSSTSVYIPHIETPSSVLSQRKTTRVSLDHSTLLPTSSQNHATTFASSSPLRLQVESTLEPSMIATTIPSRLYSTISLPSLLSSSPPPSSLSQSPLLSSYSPPSPSSPLLSSSTPPTSSSPLLSSSSPPPSSSSLLLSLSPPPPSSSSPLLSSSTPPSSSSSPLLSSSSPPPSSSSPLLSSSPPPPSSSRSSSLPSPSYSSSSSAITTPTLSSVISNSSPTRLYTSITTSSEPTSSVAHFNSSPAKVLLSTHQVRLTKSILSLSSKRYSPVLTAAGTVMTSVSPHLPVLTSSYTFSTILMSTTTSSSTNYGFTSSPSPTLISPSLISCTTSTVLPSNNYIPSHALSTIKTISTSPSLSSSTVYITNTTLPSSASIPVDKCHRDCQVGEICVEPWYICINIGENKVSLLFKMNEIQWSNDTLKNSVSKASTQYCTNQSCLELLRPAQPIRSKRATKPSIVFQVSDVLVLNNPSWSATDEALVVIAVLVPSNYESLTKIGSRRVVVTKQNLCKLIWDSRHLINRYMKGASMIRLDGQTQPSCVVQGGEALHEQRQVNSKGSATTISVSILGVLVLFLLLFLAMHYIRRRKAKHENVPRPYHTQISFSNQGFVDNADYEGVEESLSNSAYTEIDQVLNNKRQSGEAKKLPKTPFVEPVKNTNVHRDNRVFQNPKEFWNPGHNLRPKPRGTGNEVIINPSNLDACADVNIRPESSEYSTPIPVIPRYMPLSSNQATKSRDRDYVHLNPGTRKLSSHDQPHKRGIERSGSHVYETVVSPGIKNYVRRAEAGKTSGSVVTDDYDHLRQGVKTTSSNKIDDHNIYDHLKRGDETTSPNKIDDRSTYDHLRQNQGNTYDHLKRGFTIPQQNRQLKLQLKKDDDDVVEETVI